VLACFSSLISPLRGSVLDLRVKFVFRLILCPAAGKGFSDRLLRVSAAGSLSYPTHVPCFLFGLCRPLMKCTAPVFYFAKNFWALRVSVLMAVRTSRVYAVLSFPVSPAKSSSDFGFRCHRRNGCRPALFSVEPSAGKVCLHQASFFLVRS
jgi:hypothetical protein